MTELTWTQFKAGIINSGILFKLFEDDITYILFAKDKIEFKCKIDKSNDNDDKIDFETNFKIKAASMLEPVDAEGAVTSRSKAAKAGWKAQFQTVRISTSTTNGYYNKNKNGGDLGFCTYTMYDAQNQITTDEASCVKTILTWEPTFNMELVGGRLFQKHSPTSDIWLYVTAAAHIPANYGGSIEFLQGGMNLQDIPESGEVDFDGRVAKYIPYDTVYHSGRFEILLKHDAGVKHSFSLVFELFKP